MIPVILIMSVEDFRVWGSIPTPHASSETAIGKLTHTNASTLLGMGAVPHGGHQNRQSLILQNIISLGNFKVKWCFSNFDKGHLLTADDTWTLKRRDLDNSSWVSLSLQLSFMVPKHLFLHKEHQEPLWKLLTDQGSYCTNSHYLCLCTYLHKTSVQGIQMQ